MLSTVHEMLAKIGRETHPHRINRIINHPEVAPYVRGYHDGRLDVSDAVHDTSNYLLMGEHGGVLFKKVMLGLYEAHTQVVPEGRGKWTLAMVRAALHWMFTRTEAMEIVTRCPAGNIGALALVKRVGGRKWLVNPSGWVLDKDPVATTIFRLGLQDWIETAPGLAERGRWFRGKLEIEAASRGTKIETPDIPEDYDRQIGAAIEMFLADQAAKGSVIYNRFAAMADWPSIKIVQANPLTISSGSALITFRDGDFWVPSIL